MKSKDIVLPEVASAEGFSKGDKVSFDGIVFEIASVYRGHPYNPNDWGSDAWCIPVEDNLKYDTYCIEDIKKIDSIPLKDNNPSVSEGGSLRHNKGKPEFSHLSPEFIQDMMGLMTKSADKYGYLNWTKAQDLRTASDSLMRHFLSFLQGEDLDDESKMSHLTHIAVNAMIMWQNHKDFGDEIDNRYTKAKDKAQNE